MGIRKFLMVGLMSCGLVFSMMAKDAAVPTAEQLSTQANAIREMLSPSNTNDFPQIRKEDLSRFRYGLNDVIRLVRQQNIEEALQQINQLMDAYTGATNTPFYLAVQQFKTDATALITATSEAFLRDAKALEEVAPQAFIKSTTAEEMLAYKTMLDEFRSRLDNSSSRRGMRIPQDMYSKFNTLSSMAGEWATVLAGVESGDMSRANTSLQNLKGSYSTHKIMISKEMRKRIEEIENKQVELATAAIEKLKKSCLAAESSDELNKEIESFMDFTSKNQSLLYNNRAVQSKIERLQQGSRQWIRIMIAIENENYQEAIQYISNMESDSYGGSIFSPKELADKKAALMKKNLTGTKKDKDPVVLLVVDLMAKVTGPDGFGPIKQVISSNSRNSSGFYQSELQYLLNDITALEVMNEAMKSGQYATIFQQYGYRSSSESSQHRWKPLMDKFRSQIRNQAIGALCGIKDFEVDKGETPESVLQEHITNAASKKKWDLVLKYLEGYRQVFAFYPASGMSGMTWLTDETTAVRSFIAAQNFEKAEEYERALVNYLAILNSTSKRTPVEEATVAIKKIKEKHPEAYEKASKLPPAPQPGIPGMPLDYQRMVR
jgi:hypothetical protein